MTSTAATNTTEVAQIAEVLAAATAAAPGWEAIGRAGRAAALRVMADVLEADRAGIVRTAAEETALATTRLNGELTRTCFQLRLFAETLDEGSYLEAALDSAGDTPMGPRPDLRRMLVPIGPVAVFGASNFPLAFSVPGGDTASALAAGCPVVLKLHPSHPRTSQRCLAALASVAPEGVVGAVSGRAAGADLVQRPEIRAVGFTGSLAGGRALLDLIHERPDPIPFYGELSGINPVVVTPAAAVARAVALGAGFAASVTGSAGQLCTKPGLLFVPASPAGDEVVAAATAALGDAPTTPLLDDRIRESYQAGTAVLRKAARVVFEAAGDTGALLVETSTAEFDDRLVEECFGPAAVVVRYSGADDLDAGLAALPGSLTATIHADEDDWRERLTALLLPRAGRLLYRGFPTGVAVSPAQHHGGPWPSTNSLHTSVGTTAIRRFLRPVTWQDAPPSVLPAELRDGPSDIPRRLDGTLVLPG